MKRRDIVSVAAPGDYGKPRPAVVVQADALTTSYAILTNTATRRGLLAYLVNG